MGNFNKSRGKSFDRGSGFDKRGGGRSNFSRNRDHGRPSMHQSICDECGQPCEVPFRPTEGKPIYCNACFGNKGEGRNNRRGDKFNQKRSGGDRPDSGSSEKQLIALNEKMDQLIKIVETIVQDKPTAKVKSVIKKPFTAKTKKTTKKKS